MLPAPITSVLSRPHLPIPPVIRRPTEQNFYRSRNNFQDSSSLSPMVTEAYRPQSTIPETSKNLDYDQGTISGHQNKPRLSQTDDNRFQINQHGMNHLGYPQQLQRRCLNEEGSRSCNPNGTIINTRMVSDPLAPATDVYSNLNRLSELFPDIHPTQLHRVFDDCGRDFLRTIDNVLYARRFRKSVISHMSKFRSFNRSQAQKNIMLSSQQHKERNTEDITNSSQQLQPESQTHNSPKTRRLTKTTNSQQSKRSTIFAFATPKSQNDPIKDGEKFTPRTSQSCSSFSGSAPIAKSTKKHTPPPNVFLHPVVNDQGGSGNKSPNPRYMISLKRPHTLHYGVSPAISSNSNLPLVLDNPIYQNTLPLPNVNYSLANNSIKRDSSLKSLGSLDDKFLESFKEKQQQHPPSQNVEQVEQALPTQQGIQREHEVHKQVEQTDGANLSSTSNKASEHFEIVQQANDVDTWSNLMKTFCEPLTSVDTEGNRLMMQLIPNSPEVDSGINETHECRSYLYRHMPQVTSDEVKQTRDVEVRKDLNVPRDNGSVNEENDEEERDALPDKIQREGSSSHVITPLIRKRNLTSLDYQSDETNEKKIMSEESIEVVCEVEDHEQNLGQLILEEKCWTENEENSEEQGNDFDLNQSDDDYTPD